MDDLSQLSKGYIQKNTGAAAIGDYDVGSALGLESLGHITLRGLLGSPEAFARDIMGLPDANTPEQTLEATWWIFDKEPGMDDIMHQAGECAECLQQMFDKLEIYPFLDTKGENRIFLARFEMPKYNEDFVYEDAVHTNDPNVKTLDPYFFIDFLGGFPIHCIEMLVFISQYSTKKDKVAAKPGEDAAAPPVPDQFFTWPEKDKILFNYTGIAAPNCEWMATNLEGEPAPRNIHWWVRTFLGDKDAKEQPKFPIPGEFIGMAVRIMPNKPWGTQKSSPFIYSGNWFDTVYYTAGIITEIIDPTGNMPYPTYKVRWRTQTAHGIYTLTPSDFAEYKVGDRVTILKDVSTKKKSQLWKDDDMKKMGDECQIVPITFYDDLASKKA
jgi:hypothetical protein